MTDRSSPLGGAERCDIMKAVLAIERQLANLRETPDWRTLWVIGVNLARIRITVAGRPPAGSN